MLEHKITKFLKKAAIITATSLPLSGVFLAANDVFLDGISREYSAQRYIRISQKHEFLGSFIRYGTAPGRELVYIADEIIRDMGNILPKRNNPTKSNYQSF